MDELKTCTFCGGVAVFTRPDDTKVKVRCTDCGISSRYYITEDESVIAWNRRLGEADAIQRTRKAIRDALATEADLSSNWNVGKRPGAASRAYGMASGLCMTVEVR